MSTRSLLTLVIFGLVACSDGGSSTPDLGSDAAISDGGGDPLAALVEEVVSPNVAPELALTDASKTAALVAAVVTPSARGVYGFGATEAGGDKLPDGDTIFQIGSVSKALTGLILAHQVGAGKVGKDDLVSKHLPALQGVSGVEGVTLELLVTHYAGLKPMPELQVTDPLSPAKGYSLPQLKSFLSAEEAPKVGVSYKYSNLGIGLLGLALEKNAGASGYHGLLTSTLAKELGISDLWGQVSALPADHEGRLARGIAAPQGKARQQGKLSEMGVLAAAGETCATGKSMLKLVAALCGADKSAWESDIVMALEPLRKGKDPDSIGYVIEVEAAQPGHGRTYKKGGVTAGGYTAYVVFRREPKPVGVVVLTNVASYQGAVTMARTIMERAAALP